MRSFRFTKGGGVVSLVLGGILMVIASAASCGELRPYSLPSQQSQVLSNAAERASAVPQGDVYRNFESRIRRLNDAQMRELRASLMREQDSARASQQQDRARHYAKLLAIQGRIESERGVEK